MKKMYKIQIKYGNIRILREKFMQLLNSEIEIEVKKAQENLKLMGLEGIIWIMNEYNKKKLGKKLKWKIWTHGSERTNDIWNHKNKNIFFCFDL